LAALRSSAAVAVATKLTRPLRTPYTYRPPPTQTPGVNSRARPLNPLADAPGPILPARPPFAELAIIAMRPRALNSAVTRPARPATQ